MQWMTMAQAVGEAPIYDAGMTTDEVDEYFGGDMEAAREHFDYEREQSVAKLQATIDAYRALYGEL